MVKNQRSRKCKPNNKLNSKGFTLIELLVVIVILAAIAGIVGPRLFKKLGKAKIGTARTQISQIESALDSFRLDTGSYPSTSQGLAALEKDPGIDGWDGPYLKKSVPKDPWDNPYAYVYPGTHGEYDLSSYGQDGQPGGSGDNVDINSWE